MASDGGLLYQQAGAVLQSWGFVRHDSGKVFGVFYSVMISSKSGKADVRRPQNTTSITNEPANPHTHHNVLGAFGHAITQQAKRFGPVGLAAAKDINNLDAQTAEFSVSGMCGNNESGSTEPASLQSSLILGGNVLRRESFPPLEQFDSPTPIPPLSKRSTGILATPVFRTEMAAPKSILRRMSSMRRRGERQLQAADIQEMSATDRFKARQRQKAILVDPNQPETTHLSALMSLYQLGVYNYGTPEDATHYALMKGMDAIAHYPAAQNGAPHPSGERLESLMLSLCSSSSDVLYDANSFKERSLNELWDKEKNLRSADFSVVEGKQNSTQDVHTALDQVVDQINQSIDPENRRKVTKTDVVQRYSIKQSAKLTRSSSSDDELSNLVKQRKAIKTVSDLPTVDENDRQSLLQKMQMVNKSILELTKI